MDDNEPDPRESGAIRMLGFIRVHLLSELVSGKTNRCTTMCGVMGRFYFVREDQQPKCKLCFPEA